MYRVVTALCVAVALARAAPPGDLIARLPGLAQMPAYKMYSGYLEASDTKHFFYWFAESQKDPANDPLVLWLNGGPGCSSLLGFLTENGPLHIITDADHLLANKYSWNKIANMLYIESPTGVGFSYDDNGDNLADDDQVSQLNHNALVDFMKKFPEYSSNPFFITGESYGGVYLPTLAVRIVEGSFKFNFQGMAIGNALSNYRLNDNSVVFYVYHHGLFGEVLWQELTTLCCNGTATRENCNFHDNPIGACMDAVEEVTQWVYHADVNAYAFFDTCPNDMKPNLMFPLRYQLAMSHLFVNNPKVQALKDYLSRLQSKPRSVKFIDSDVCYNNSALVDWLSRQDVRSALHVHPNLPEWTNCNNKINYTAIYRDMSPQYHRLFKDPNFRALLYNGDTDMVCNFLGDQWFAAALKRTPKRSHAPWFVDGQVAGYVRVYEGLTFTTIRGAGHLVPQWRPAYALAMFDKFINNQPFNDKH